MGQAVKLGADLPDFAGDQFIVPHDVMRPHRPAGGMPVLGSGNGQAVMTLAEQGHAGLIDAPKRIDFSCLDKSGGTGHGIGRDPVHRPALIIRPPCSPTRTPLLNLR